MGALIIALAVIFTGLGMTAISSIFVMFHSGKWTLPNSEQRRLQRAENNAKIASYEADAAETRTRVAELEFQRHQKELLNLDLEYRRREMEFQHQLALDSGAPTTNPE